MEDLLDAITSAGEQASGSIAHLPHPDFTAVPFSVKHFSPLTAVAGDAAHIDGGNAELIAGGSFSLQFIRVAQVSFAQGKRESMRRRECYLLVEAKKGAEGLVYETRIFPVSGEWQQAPRFRANDRALRQESGMAAISSVGEVVRRFAEIAEAMAALDKGVVVMDGTLESRYTGEEVQLQQLRQRAAAKNAVVVAVAKTSTMLTDEGSLFTALLRQHCPARGWSYYPVAESESVQIRFCKFHGAAEHIFRTDSFAESQRALQILAENSRDVVFPGYPYGLVVADRVARVSNRERELMKARILARTGKEVAAQLSSGNAHQILDSV